MASPPCCPPDSIPALDHTPPFVGRVVDADNGGTAMKTYITGNAQDLASSAHIVLVFSDVFGYDSGRHFEFADHLATLLNNNSNVKAAVLVPDVFLGRPLFVDYRFLPEFLSGLICIPSFLYRIRIQGIKQFTLPITDTLFPWLEKQGVDFNTVNLSFAGFCFGSWLGAKLIAQSRAESDETITKCPKWTCGIGIHPALHVERVEGGTEEALATSLRDTPVKLMPAGNDAYHPGKSEVVQILAGNQSISEEEVSVPFDDVKHGFCSRGDSNKEEVRQAQTKAEALAAEFILKHSKG